MLSRLMTVREQMILGGAAAAIVIGAATLYLLDGRETPAEPVAILDEHKPLPAVAPEIFQLEAARARIQAAETAPAATSAPASPTTGGGAVASTTLPEGATVDTLPPAAPSVIPDATGQEVAAPETAGGDVTVAIEGPVRAPGIYTLPGGQRVKDLIETAGGAVAGADLSDINLLALLMDGTTLTIPWQTVVQRGENSISVRRPPNTAVYNPPQYTRSGTRQLKAQQDAATAASPVDADGVPAAAAAATGVASGGNGLINLNTASAGELATLPGIGPALAKRIIDYRTQQRFTSVEDLTNVSGIGEKRLDAVRNLVTVQ